MDTKKVDVLEQYGLTEAQLKKMLVAKTAGDIKPLGLQLDPNGSYTFGAIGDTHLCSTHEQLRELKTYYEVVRSRGIADVYHAGDILDGQNVYAGQWAELHTLGADNQVAYVVAKYPKVDGVTTHFITGNHDYSHYRDAGVNVGVAIAEKRKDLHYLGMFQADVFWNKIRLIRLIHPDGGMPYALTYRAQVILSRGMKDKPRVLLLGHLHTMYHFMARNVLCYGVGSFSGQSSFLLRKGIETTAGGWIITLRFGKDSRKSIVGVTSEFVPFYG
jgi:predicted phosphodiesterase